MLEMYLNIWVMVVVNCVFIYFFRITSQGFLITYKTELSDCNDFCNSGVEK